MRFMRTFCHMPSSLAISVALGVAGLGLALLPAQTATAAPAASAVRPSVSTNAARATPEAPKSVFVVPATSQDGKDPFFPQSTRLRPAKPVTAAKLPPRVPDLELKGISGTPDRLMAIINNRTFERGEEGEVAWNGGRVRVTCVDIKPNSVRVSVNGQERVLNLHTRF
jgi:hypothetical protein